MSVFKTLGIATIFYMITTSEPFSQWQPSGDLLTVSSSSQCSMTAGKVAALHSGILFYCPARASEIDAEITDASHFYFVHEYGLIAAHTTSGKLADCWAAHKLSVAPKGPHYVRQWIKHWRLHGIADTAYGTIEDRISNVRSCCACGV